MLDNAIEIFLPPHVRNQVIDRLVEVLANISPDSRWSKLMRSFRSDAEFHAAFEYALKRAIERFITEYPDQELTSALIHNTRFWDLPSVQNALIVECRVYMVAGDVTYRKNNYLEAIKLYEHAMRITQEEEDVDFDARLHYCLGLAYLDSNDLMRAESEFSIVLDIEQQAINIVLIYAKYGLARVEQAKGDIERARFLAREAQEELSRSIASHQLLGQLENLLKALDAQ